MTERESLIYAAADALSAAGFSNGAMRSAHALSFGEAVLTGAPLPSLTDQRELAAADLRERYKDVPLEELRPLLEQIVRMAGS